MMVVTCLMNVYRNSTLLFEKGKEYKVLDYTSFEYFIDCDGGGEIIGKKQFNEWFKL